jgi:phosphoglycolate phosphatase-like HAD superfamily hydrolase
MVGDSQMDMECARRAGMDGALALWDSDARGSSLTYQSNWRFDTAESFQRAVGYLPIYS